MEDNVFARGYAQESYERLILQKHTIFFDGLWEFEGRYYVLIGERSKDMPDQEFAGLVSWFDESCRIIGTPVKIVKKLPDGSVSVPERTVSQLSQHHGVPFTAPEFNGLLKTILSKGFPRFGVCCENGGVKFVVESALTSDQLAEVDIALANLGLDVEAEVVVDAISCNEEAVDVAFAKGTKKAPPEIVRLAFEEDEDFWVDNKFSLFAEGNIDRHYFLSSSPSAEESCCLVNCTAVVPGNLRGYLTLYKMVWIVMPLAELSEAAFKGFNASENELLELAARGRIGFVLPGGLPFYPVGFLAELLAVAPRSIIFSKRLAAASVAESRRRNPLIFPSLNNVERRTVLDLLSTSEFGGTNELAQMFVQHFSEVWPSLEYSFSELGAMAMMRNGLSKVATGVAEKYHAVKLPPVMQMSMASVEWAAALGAVYSPIKSPGFDEGPLAEFCGSIITGVKQDSIVKPVGDMGTLVEGLLCLDNNAPILEVSDVFDGSDMPALQRLVQEKLVSGMDVSEYIAALNDKVKRFERNQEKVRRLDLVGMAGGFAAVASASGIASYVPITAWILQKVFMQSDSFVHGPVLDWIRAKAYMTTQDVVLVSRLRKKN
ncbi:hypothetical protein [Pseudomonas sp. B15(2017)]|uniref:hypothetical protein n=1 Tax=Pseudomonas sp. B15(2017) TaxID=1981744 RepID=UPI00111C39B7|nr:hypothetical protein [Pseudomonas sp. B15(2017)]